MNPFGRLGQALPAERAAAWRRALGLLASVVALMFSACDTTKDEPEHPQTSFTSHEEAVRYIRTHFNRETVRPDDPSISRMDYYYARGRGYLMLYFHTNRSKAWLFQSVPAVVWEDFKRAPSKVRFYHDRIGKGQANRYVFELNR